MDTIEDQSVLKKIKNENESLKSLKMHFKIQNRLLTIAWIVIIVISIALTAYLVIETIITYLHYGVFTTSRTVIETPTTFPKVTICNYNQFTTKYGSEFVKAINQEYFPDRDIFDPEKMKNYTATEKFEQVEAVYAYATAKILNKNYTKIDRKKLGHNIEDILFSCTFNNKPCNHEDFIWTFDRFYGNCYVFNSGYNSTGHRVELKKSTIVNTPYSNFYFF